MFKSFSKYTIDCQKIMDKNDFLLDKTASLEKLFHLRSDELKTDQQDNSYISLPDELVKNKKHWICEDKCKFPKNFTERIYLKIDKYRCH